MARPDARDPECTLAQAYTSKAATKPARSNVGRMAERHDDYYGMLGVSEGATDAELKKAFRKRAHQVFPDRMTAGEQEGLQRAQHAYGVLSDPDTRRQHDDARRGASTKPSSSDSMSCTSGGSAEGERHDDDTADDDGIDASTATDSDEDFDFVVATGRDQIGCCSSASDSDDELYVPPCRGGMAARAPYLPATALRYCCCCSLAPLESQTRQICEALLSGGGGGGGDRGQVDSDLPLPFDGRTSTAIEQQYAGCPAESTPPQASGGGGGGGGGGGEWASWAAEVVPGGALPEGRGRPVIPPLLSHASTRLQCPGAAARSVVDRLSLAPPTALPGRNPPSCRRCPCKIRCPRSGWSIPFQ